MIKNLKIFFLVLLVISSSVELVSAQSGTELISITVSHAKGIAGYSPDSEIHLPEGNVKITLDFKDTRSGEMSFVINAPFAQDVMSSSGTITRSGSIWILKMYGLKGQSFKLDVVGELADSSYIEIIQGRDVPAKIAYVALKPEKDSPEPISGMNLYNLAEKNIEKVRDMGMDTTLLEAKLENARLKLKMNDSSALKMLNSILQDTQSIIDAREKLEIKLADLKNQVITGGRLNEAGPLLLNAEKAIKGNNFEAAERYIKQIEDMLKPSLIRDISSYFGYIISGLIAVAAVLLFKRRQRSGGKGNGGLGL